MCFDIDTASIYKEIFDEAKVLFITPIEGYLSKFDKYEYKTCWGTEEFSK